MVVSCDFCQILFLDMNPTTSTITHTSPLAIHHLLGSSKFSGFGVVLHKKNDHSYRRLRFVVSAELSKLISLNFGLDSQGSAEVVFIRRSDAFAALKQYNNVQLDGKFMKIEIVGANTEIPVSARVNVVGGANGRRTRTVVMTSIFDQFHLNPIQFHSKIHGRYNISSGWTSGRMLIKHGLSGHGLHIWACNMWAWDYRRVRS